MDLSNFDSPIAALSGLVIAVGIMGIFVPAIPGLVVCWLGVLAWAVLGEGAVQRWAVLGLATVVAVIGLMAKYALPSRNLKRAGVPALSVFVGGVLGIIGFFVIPVVGLILGFIFGIWLSEQIRLRRPGAAWRSTRHALGAVGLSILIELSAGLIVAVVWALGVASA